MLFDEFARRLEVIEAEPARLAITSHLAELYQNLSFEELKPASYLLQGSLVPPYQSLEFQLSTKMVIRALERVRASQDDGRNDESTTDLFGRVVDGGEADNLTKKFKHLGDIGLLAFEVRSEVEDSKVSGGDKATDLELLLVFQHLSQIALASGQGSQEEKINLLTDLFFNSTPLGAKYVARIIIGKLRLGFSTMTMLDALSWATKGNKDDHDILELAYQKHADVGELAEFYLRLDKKTLSDPEKLQNKLEEYTVTAGIPVVPALCQRLNSTAEIIEKMSEVVAEPKYDGLRVQIHMARGDDGTKITAYTRNLEEVTHQFPELQLLPQATSAQSLILDAEAIGYDVQTGELLPFQQTITRKRKHGIKEASSLVPIRFYVFDVLLVDGEAQIAKPLQTRKALLSKIIKPNQTFLVTPYITTKNPEELKEFHDQALADGLEGMVAKQVDDIYRSGRKGWSWVKIKEAEGSTGKLADTLDLVVLGYYYGRGKRSGLGIGALLVATLGAGVDGDSDNDSSRGAEGGTGDLELLTVAKIGTGITDELFQEIKKKADAIAIKAPLSNYNVPKELKPDVWVSPDIVAEIAADEVTNSPLHSAGLALRFPRLIKLREDKSWEQATTLDEIKNIMEVTQTGV